MCENILDRLDRLDSKNDENITKKKKFIENITENYISCEKTFIDSYIFFEKTFDDRTITRSQN